MKLRNKKTGDIWEFEDFVMKASYETAKRAGAISGSLTCYANSIAELNEEWEDVDSTNDTNIPLIKDEKIRKAVRAWAEAIDVETVVVEQANFDGEFLELTDVINSIRFAVKRPKDIKAGERYAIEELCGEEEE